MIGAALTDTVSDFEVIWTLVATTGLAFSLLNLAGNVADYRYIKHANIQNGRRELAPLAVFAEAKRAYLQLLFLVIGIYSMTRIDVPGLDGFDYVMAIVLRWGFLIGACLTCAATIYAWRVRRFLLRFPAG